MDSVSREFGAVDGVRAPYDEENTLHILKIEFVPEGRNILEVWFTYANKDLFSGRNTEMLKFMRV
jgi:hypothetical protein